MKLYNILAYIGIFIIPKDTDKLLRIIDNDIELKGDGSNE